MVDADNINDKMMNMNLDMNKASQKEHVHDRLLPGIDFNNDTLALINKDQ